MSRFILKSWLVVWMVLGATLAMESDDSLLDTSSSLFHLKEYETIHIYAPWGFNDEIREHFKDRINPDNTLNITNSNEQLILLEWLEEQYPNRQNQSFITTNSVKQEKFMKWVKENHPEYFHNESHNQHQVSRKEKTGDHLEDIQSAHCPQNIIQEAQPRSFSIPWGKIRNVKKKALKITFGAPVAAVTGAAGAAIGLTLIPSAAVLGAVIGDWDLYNGRHSNPVTDAVKWGALAPVAGAGLGGYGGYKAVSMVFEATDKVWDVVS